MAKITGLEAASELPPKVLQIYEAVEKLIMDGEDINGVSVSTITETAGIGKGTAYDYFETKDEIIAYSLLYQIRCLAEELREMFSVEDTFKSQIGKCLREIEQQKEKQNSFLRFVHIMTANSGYCRLVKEKMEQEEMKSYLPMQVFEDIIVAAKERGEVKQDIPVEYAIYAVFSKLMTYMISFNACESFRNQSEKLQGYFYQSILDELCEKKA